MARKPVGPKKIPVNLKLLSAEDKAALMDEARKSVAAEMDQDARDLYFQQALSEARREHTPADQILHVTMDMAPFLPHIMIDGVQYFHGYGYDVERSRAIVLYEQMQRSWSHQDEIDGRSRTEAYRRPSAARLGPHMAGVPTRGANGVITMSGD